jgi:hypothetical protein
MQAHPSCDHVQGSGRLQQAEGFSAQIIAGKLADFGFASNAMHSLLFNGGNGVLKWRPGG